MVIGILASRGNSELVEAVAAGEARPAPGFTLPILANGGAIGRADGEMLALADLGRAVVLNFWASWCTPCKAEAGCLEAAWHRHRGAGVVVLGLDIRDLSEDARAFIDRYGQTYLTCATRATAPPTRTGSPASRRPTSSTPTA